jgi:hypothetical protein
MTGIALKKVLLMSSFNLGSHCEKTFKYYFKQQYSSHNMLGRLSLDLCMEMKKRTLVHKVNIYLCKTLARFAQNTLRASDRLQTLLAHTREFPDI